MSETEIEQAPEQEAPRPVRMCDSCGVVDDHPRHVVGYAPDDAVTAARVGALAIQNASDADREAIIAQVQDTSTTMKHMDCCRADGCPDGTCYAVTAGAEQLRGYDLLNHLTSQPAPQADNLPTEG